MQFYHVLQPVNWSLNQDKSKRRKEKGERLKEKVLSR
jgi:hypothetical protein